MNPRKVLFGVVAAAPFLMVALMAAAISVFGVDATTGTVGAAVPVLITIAAGLLVGWLLYIRDVWTNPIMPAGKRWLWTAVLVLGKLYALPFYWWFYVRPTGGSPVPERN